MKETQIIYSAPMVLAKLAGRKTETRRIMKPQPASIIVDEMRPSPTKPGCWEWRCMDTWNAYSDSVKCPYGVPGDRLWTKENFRISDYDSYYTPICAHVCGVYCADSAPFSVELTPEESHKFRPWVRKEGNIPAIFMFRSLSRFLDEITNIRAQRVQEITEEEAIAEGIESHNDDGATYYGPFGRGHASAKSAYGILWDSINAKREGGFSWKQNGYVWVITNKPVTP